MQSSAWDSASSRESDAQGFVEVFDARREPLGWMQSGFDGALWGAPTSSGRRRQAHGAHCWREHPLMFEAPTNIARVAATGEVQRNGGAFPGQLQAEVIRPASTVSIVHPEFLASRAGPTVVQTTQSGRDAAILLDFGRVVSGFPYLELSGVDGATIDVSFSEWLDDGQIVTTRGPTRFCDIVGKPFHTADRVILRQGPMRWQRFFPTGFRYLQLTVRNAAQPVSLDAVGAIFTSYPFTLRGWFRSSDDRSTASGLPAPIPFSSPPTTCSWTARGASARSGWTWSRRSSVTTCLASRPSPPDFCDRRRSRRTLRDACSSRIPAGSRSSFPIRRCGGECSCGSTTCTSAMPTVGSCTRSSIARTTGFKVI